MYAEAALKDKLLFVLFCASTIESWRTIATKMKENATRKMAPRLGPKSSATGTEKIFRALLPRKRPRVSGISKKKKKKKLVSYRAAIGTFNGGRPGRHSPHLHCSSSVKLCTRPLLVTLLLFLLPRAESLPAHGDVERNPGPEIDHDDSPLARRQRNDASPHPSSCDRVRDRTSQPTELQRTSCPGSPLDNTQVRLAVPECQRDGCGCLQRRGSLGFRTCPCIKCRQHGQSLSRSALAKHLRVDHVLSQDYFPEWLKDLQLRLCDKCHRPYAILQGHRCKPSNLGHQSQSVAGAGAPASVDAVPRPREENATATHPPNTAEAWAACPPDLPWATVDDIDLSTIFQGDVRTLIHLPRNPSIRRLLLPPTW